MNTPVETDPIPPEFSQYVGEPCAVRFMNSIGDVYVGISKAIDITMPKKQKGKAKKKKGKIKIKITFKWLARVTTLLHPPGRPDDPKAVHYRQADKYTERDFELELEISTFRIRGANFFRIYFRHYTPADRLFIKSDLGEWITLSVNPEDIVRVEATIK